MPSRTARRLALAVTLAAVIPLGAAIYLARSLVGNVSSLFSNPRVGQELDRSLALYQELATATKQGMRYEADAIAAHEPLRAAALAKGPQLEQQLAEAFSRYDNLALLAVTDADGNTLAVKRRAEPVDESKELQLEVRRALTDEDEGPMLLATFVTPRARFDELAEASETTRMYQQLESSRVQIEHGYLYAFAALLAITLVAAVAVGTLLARSVTRRIGLLANATQTVGTGDLSVRVPVSGNDEITDLARAFNSMLLELERSRRRIEFLQRMGTWQEMARRLAHEIKNPLTPIQLAVQEIHWRYGGDDAAYRALLDTTRKVVEEEVGTLRRLVTEFSAFARLPRAELKEADLAEFLREQREHMSMFYDDEAAGSSDADGLAEVVDLQWQIPDMVAKVYMDRQMLHRVLVNLVRNAAQALRDARRDTRGQVLVCLRAIDPDWFAVEVDDDGPGIPEAMRESVFDPYVTTKDDGTGLGLSIVKKIVMEHGGVIEASASDFGGARMTMRLPRAGTAASLAVRDQLPPSMRPSGVVSAR